MEMYADMTTCSLHTLVVITLLISQSTVIAGAEVRCEEVDQCSCQMTDTGKMITLWGIDDPNQPKFTDTSHPSYDILYNPCTYFSRGRNCDEEIACVQKKDSKEYFSAGRKGENNVRYADGKVVFEYTGEKQDGATRETKVELVCDRSVEHPQMTEPKIDAKNVITFQLKTKCACPGECRRKEPGSGSNMSVGSILITIFFVMLGAYFILGHLFLKYHRNLDGTDAIPNYDFWMELPEYIKEGFAFTKKTVMGMADNEYDSI